MIVFVDVIVIAVVVVVIVVAAVVGQWIFEGCGKQKESLFLSGRFCLKRPQPAGERTTEMKVIKNLKFLMKQL